MTNSCEKDIQFICSPNGERIHFQIPWSAQVDTQTYVKYYKLKLWTNLENYFEFTQIKDEMQFQTHFLSLMFLLLSKIYKVSKCSKQFI